MRNHHNKILAKSLFTNTICPHTTLKTVTNYKSTLNVFPHIYRTSSALNDKKNFPSLLENIHHSEYSCNVCYHLTIMLIKHQIDHHRSSSTSKRRKVLGFFENIEQRSIEFPETNQNYEILINVALRKVEYIADRTNDDISEQKTPYSKKHHQSDEPELIQVKLENNVASSSRTNIKQSAGTDKIKRAKKARPDVRQKKRKRLTCDVCERQFWNKVGILNHLQRKHFPVAKKQRSKASECILCETCGREYSSRKRLLTHLITHRNRRLHKCTMCDREFLDRGALREHVYAHTGERPFKCLYGCEQSFGHASNRRQHHRSFHQPEKQFTCPICAKTMTRKCGYL